MELKVGQIYWVEDPETFDGVRVRVKKVPDFFDSERRPVFEDPETGREFQTSIFYASDIGDYETRLRRAINSHDLTYSYSDSRGAWDRGQKELQNIERLARKNPELATQLWNEKVDRELIPEARGSFYRTFIGGIK